MSTNLPSTPSPHTSKVGRCATCAHDTLDRHHAGTHARLAAIVSLRLSRDLAHLASLPGARRRARLRRARAHRQRRVLMSSDEAPASRRRAGHADRDHDAGRDCCGVHARAMARGAATGVHRCRVCSTPADRVRRRRRVRRHHCDAGRCRAVEPADQPDALGATADLLAIVVPYLLAGSCRAGPRRRCAGRARVRCRTRSGSAPDFGRSSTGPERVVERRRTARRDPCVRVGRRLWRRVAGRAVPRRVSVRRCHVGERRRQR